ncbi:helicase-associated domain-containing protein [Paenibacillus sp. GCM10012307]|uniref:Helicase-associated domain-containing protein n=1 Tax=Paenibacillus roseus TaxID=2798579 RepID=A0A934J7P3_9BACL|nr:helicase-associated domain-containing protein [Paenibacillus roseus]MBJ6363289.1 helicase-associated domain-containing protein [Paenibacillus roseus]
MRTAEIALRFGESELNAFIASHPAWEEAASEGLGWRQAQLDSRVLAAAAAKLSSRARALLELALRQLGPLPFDEERLRKAGAIQGRWSGAELLQGLIELRQAGIVFAVRKSWGDELFFLPGDAFAAWLHALFPFGPVPLAREQARQITDRQGADCAPLGMKLLDGLRTLVMAGMRFNAKGVLPKKVISKTAGRLFMKEGDLEGWTAAFAYRDDYPKPVALLLDLALTLDLLLEDEDGYVWNAETGEVWLNLPEIVRERELAALFVSRYMTADFNLAFPSAALLHVAPFKWYAVGDAAAWLSKLAISSPNADMQASNRQQAMLSGLACCLRVLQACGWLEQGRTKDGIEVFRWRVLAANVPQAEPGRIYVQPDCEIIAAQDVPFYVRWHLEEVAEFVQAGVVTVYRMTKAKAAQAVKQGWTGEGMLQFLRDASGNDVPENVAALILEWSRQAGSVQIEQATLLRCAGSEIAQQLASEPSLRELLVEQLGDRTFVVELRQLNTLLKGLDQLGCCAVKPPLSEQLERAGKSRNKSRSQTAKPQAGLFYDPVGLKHFTLHTEVPLLIKAHEALKQLPSSWTRQLRAYHSSTKREILERALELHTAVELRSDSSILSFIPSTLHEAEGSWRISGWLKQEDGAEPSEISLRPEMWEEMRLIVPATEE